MEKATSNDAPILMTPEQKFFFDLRGWILLPSVLSEPEIEEARADSLCGCQTKLSGCRLQNLLDPSAQSSAF